MFKKRYRKYLAYSKKFIRFENKRIRDLKYLKLICSSITTMLIFLGTLVTCAFIFSQSDSKLIQVASGYLTISALAFLFVRLVFRKVN